MLTTAQLQTLKGWIDADPILSLLPLNSDTAFEIAAALNQEVDPAFVVWRTAVTLREIMSNGFRWTDVDGLSAAKYRTWELMNSLGTIDPSKPNVRQGLRDTWGAGSLQELAITPHLKRNATQVEKLLATGTGTDATPATLSFEGTISFNEVEDARALA